MEIGNRLIAILGSNSNVLRDVFFFRLPTIGIVLMWPATQGGRIAGQHVGYGATCIIRIVRGTKGLGNP